LVFGNNPVPARRFCAIESAIRAYEQGRQITPLGGRGGQTHADRSPEGLLARTMYGGGKRLPHTFADGYRVRRRRVRKQTSKLFPA
jgi:hypothetical protein